MRELRERLFAVLGVSALAAAGCGKTTSTGETSGSPPPGRSSCSADAVREVSCMRNGLNQQVEPCPPRKASIGAALPWGKFDDHGSERASLDPVLSSPDACCYSWCTPIPVLASVSPPAPESHAGRTLCFEELEKTTKPSADFPGCPAGVDFAKRTFGGDFWTKQGQQNLNTHMSVAAPFDPAATRIARALPREESSPEGPKKPCCYTERLAGPAPLPVPGRPLRQESAIIVADARARSDWNEPPLSLSPELATLSAHARARLAHRWARDAALEHASIASLGRAALMLMALGAPSSLVAATQRAALDEIIHAQNAYALASAFAGEPVGPGELPEAVAPMTTDARAFAMETFVDGCIGETCASLLAKAALEQTEDDAVRSALERVARDEADHAELAWSTFAWLVRTGRAPAEHELEAALETRAARITAEPRSRDPELASYGVLDGVDEANVILRALDDVIRPCLRALVAHELT